MSIKRAIGRVSKRASKRTIERTVQTRGRGGVGDAVHRRVYRHLHRPSNPYVVGLAMRDPAIAPPSASDSRNVCL